MKFLTHFAKNKNTGGKWVYLQADSDVKIEAGLDAMGLVDFGEDFAEEVSQLNPAVEGAVTHTRVETAGTVDSHRTAIGDRAGELMQKSQRDAGAHTLMGVFNLHSPTGNWLKPDRAGLESINPVKWLVGIFNSKGPIIAAFKDNIDSIIAMNANSDLIDTQVMHAFLSNNLADTVDNISQSKFKNTGLSLASIEVFERGINSFFPKTIEDYDKFEEKLLERLESEEKIKKFVRFGTFAYKHRLRRQAKTLRNQFEKGHYQLLENIEAAKEAQRRVVENINAKIFQYQAGLEEQGDMDNYENFWWMVTEIIQNPDEFVTNPKEEYFGIKWREVFDCGKGTSGAINFLDTLNAREDDLLHVLDLPAIQIAHQNNMNMMDNVRQRDKNLKLSMKDFDFNALRKLLYKSELDRDDSYQTTEQVVALLAEGLHRTPLNINVETEVFKDSRSMYQSPMEKLAQLGAYILNNPELLKPNSTKGLHIDILAGLKGYLFHKESELSGQLESKGLGEVGSAWSRFATLNSAENLLTTANTIMTGTLEELSANMGKMDKRVEIDNILNQLDSFYYSMEQFEKMLGDKNDEKSLYNQMTDSEREIMDNVLEFSDFAKSLKGSVKDIQEEREKFINDLATPNKTFIEDKNKRLDEYGDVMKKVTEDSGGGIGSIPNRVGGDIAEGVAMTSGEDSEQGKGSSMFGMETSLAVMEKRMNVLHKDIVKWQEKMEKRKGIPFSIIDNPKDALLPFVEMTRNSIRTLKKELGLGEGTETEIDTDRPTLNDLMRVEMAYEANNYTETMARKFLQTYNTQQWKRMVTKPIGFKLDKLYWGDTTHQTKFNPMATITNPIPPLSNLRMLPTPSGEKNPESVIYLENDEYFIKMVPPHLNSEGDQSNLFLYKKTDKDTTLNPFSAQPVAKGVVLSSSVENKTLRNNKHYGPLFKDGVADD